MKRKINVHQMRCTWCIEPSEQDYVCTPSATACIPISIRLMRIFSKPCAIMFSNYSADTIIHDLYFYETPCALYRTLLSVLIKNNRKELTCNVHPRYDARGMWNHVKVQKSFDWWQFNGCESARYMFISCFSVRVRERATIAAQQYNIQSCMTVH